MKLPIINQNKISRNNSELNFINKKINMYNNSIKNFIK